MKYFCDLEFDKTALISIAMVTEDGREFHSLINPPGKVSMYIKKLTGVTESMLRKSPKLYEVLSCICIWMERKSDNDEFYFYGKSDLQVLEEIIYRANYPLIEHIISHYKDYSSRVMEKFNFVKPISLSKLVNYYRTEVKVQTHCALDDAYDLKFIYDCVEKDNNFNSDLFKEYTTLAPINHIFVQKDKNGEVINTYNSSEEVVDWILSLPSNYKQQLKRQSIKSHLRTSINSHTTYYGYYWFKEDCGETE